jgi:hypothetical protein
MHVARVVCDLLALEELLEGHFRMNPLKIYPARVSRDLNVIVNKRLNALKNLNFGPLRVQNKMSNFSLIFISFPSYLIKFLL